MSEISQKHPSYIEHIEDWETMRDTHAGEHAVKKAGIKYLPPTSGMVLDGMNSSVDKGSVDYSGYRRRAIYRNYVQLAVEAAIGLMHNKPATIELPTAMEPLVERATPEGESLQALLQKITLEQLVAGRLGLLADMEEKPDPTRPLPYITLYKGEAIINWDQDERDEKSGSSLEFVVLDESGYVRTDRFQWNLQSSFRVLDLGALNEDGTPGKAVYRNGSFSGDNLQFSDSLMLEPAIRGKTLDQIPFVFINSKDLLSEPLDPPLLGLALLSLAIYRGEADYRQNLFMQGQDTLVTIGASTEGEVRVGTGASINLPTNGDAKYIGVNSAGLPEQRMALENDRVEAAYQAGQLFNKTGETEASGESLKTRLSAQTASLTQIAKAAALGLQTSLRHIATWMGLNPDDVKVMPNLDFAPGEMTGQELLELVSSKNQGAPISLESIHALMVRRNLTNKNFTEELASIEDEKPLLPELAEEDPDLDPARGA